MYDTIAAIIPCPSWLQPSMFDAGSLTVRIGDEEDHHWRYWRNPEIDGAYEPRFTWWPSSEQMNGAKVLDNGWLKCEFSIQQMYIQELHNRKDGVDHDTEYLGNLTQRQAEIGLCGVDSLMGVAFGGELPTIFDWSCQRVDYSWNFNVGKVLPVYLSVFEHLRLSTYSRHPFDAAEGVVFKGRGSRSRWVKFYNKVRQLYNLLGVRVAPEEHILRFEVSNYKDTTRYMADAWFGSDRTIREMVQPGRALYTLARMWDMLSLTESEGYGREEYELFRIAEVFNTRRRGTAYYVLCSWRVLGNDAYRLGHVTKSTYYRLKRELKQLGFLVSVGDGVDDREPLPALHLPFSEYIVQQEDVQNVGFMEGTLNGNKPEEFAQNTTWDELADYLGVIGPESDYLLRLANDYLEQTTARDTGVFEHVGSPGVVASPLA